MSAKLVLFTSSVFLPLVALLLAALTPPVHAATAGELLEKAIYTEETVGDLDEAIKLYEEVIAEGQAAKTAAAKAQYRLALIYQKQGKDDQATAAFKAVVENYPDESDLVAQARKHLPSELELLPAPWGEQGDEMQLNMKLPTGLDIGTMVYMVKPAKHDGKDAWRCVTRGLITVNGANTYSTVLCDKETFAPLTSYWDHDIVGTAAATYEGDKVRVKFANSDETKTIKITPPCFDNEQAAQLFRRLPLKEGYKTTVRVMSILGAGEIPLGLEVSAKESLEVPAGKFECYKLELNIGQTFWISTDAHRYVVRFAAGGVTADLARIGERSADSPASLDGDGFTLSLPEGWHQYAPRGSDEKDKQRGIHLLDPKGVVDAQVRIGGLDTLTPEERKSPTAWSQSAIEKISKAVKDFKLRDPGIEEQSFGDHAGAVMIADYIEGESAKTMYGVAVFGEKNAVNLRFTVPKEKFDELKPQLDAIVESLTVE